MRDSVRRSGIAGLLAVCSRSCCLPAWRFVISPVPGTSRRSLPGRNTHQGGVVDSTWFDFKVNDDVAGGKMQVLYRDLEFEMLDKVSLEHGLTARLQTLFTDKTRLNHANPSDDQTPAKVVAIVRERTPEVPLFKFLWETLREGILSTLGI